MSIRLVRGDTRNPLTITVTDPVSGDPVDIFGSELRFTIRPSAGSSEAVIEKVSGDGLVILDTGLDDDNRGRARVDFTDDDWSDYDLGTRSFAWDLEEIFDGKAETIAGTPLGDDPIQIVQDVTRAVVGS